MKDYSKITTPIVIIVLLIAGVFLLKEIISIALEQPQENDLSISVENSTSENPEVSTEEKFHQELAEKPVGTKEIASPYVEVTFLGKEKDSNGNEIAKFQAEFTTLPKTKADLTPIDTTWHKEGEKWIAGENLFLAIVDGKEVYIEALNDQPFSGAKKGDNVTFSPQLFVGDKEYEASGEPVLLFTDFQNENYHNNVLEWDYGIAKRRLRIIEGNIQGSWVLDKDPGELVRIKYNQNGELALNFGHGTFADGGLINVFVENNDEEIVASKEFARVDGSYPAQIADSSTFYPDADPESISVDGETARYNSGFGETWADIRANAGTYVADSGVSGAGLYFAGYNVYSPPFFWLRRSIYLFDTSGLPDDAIMSTATLSIYGSSKADDFSAAPSMNVYSSAPASSTALVATDYNIANFGATAFATAIAYANWSTVGYNDFTLNTAGIAAVSKTGVTKLGARDVVYDVGGTAPSDPTGEWYTRMFGYFSEQGSGFEPKLVVTYTIWQPRPAGVQPGGSGGFFMF